MTWQLHPSCRLERRLSSPSCWTSDNHSPCTWTLAQFWQPMSLRADEDCSRQIDGRGLTETRWQLWKLAQGTCRCQRCGHTSHGMRLCTKAFHSEYTHHSHWVHRHCTTVDDASWVLWTHYTHTHIYTGCTKKQADTALSINRIKTCHQSYFFVEVECRTSHWGKCEQAPVGIKHSVD